MSPSETSTTRLFLPPVRTFFRAPAMRSPEDLDVHVALLGVPYDGGAMVPFVRSGASRGPAAVREQVIYSYPGDYYEEGTPAAGWFDVGERRTYLEGVTMADAGDVSIAPGDSALTRDRITEAVEALAATDAIVAAVGGDHSVSFPVGRGMSRYEEVDIVHFDAHPDFWDEVNGSRFSHGSNLRRLSELPFVRNITMVGLRKCSKAVYEEATAHGVTIITARDLVEEGATAAIERRMPPAGPLYVSVDTDVLDASLVPGTTLPEPFGVPYRVLREALVAVSRRGRVVGFDLVEMTDLDGGIASARVSAWLLTHFLSAIFDARD